MAKERADLGFSDALDQFDPGEWEPSSPKRRRSSTDKTATVEAAKAAGFKSREARPQTVQEGQGAPPPRRRRTGRNAQFNLKARPDTIETFCAIADQQGWGLGETLEKAVELLEREYARK